MIEEMKLTPSTLRDRRHPSPVLRKLSATESARLNVSTIANLFEWSLDKSKSCHVVIIVSSDSILLVSDKRTSRIILLGFRG